jgi:hypothetical protein
MLDGSSSKKGKRSAREEIAKQVRADMKLKPGSLLNEIEVSPTETSVTAVCLIGVTPLIASHFPAKAMEQIVEKQTGLKAKKKEARNIDSEFEARICRLGKNYAFSVLTFKNAIIGAARMLKKGTVQMTALKPAIYVRPDGFYEETFEVGGRVFTNRTPVVQLVTEAPMMRADHVRLAGQNKGADVRFRPEYPEGWKVKLVIEYNPDVVSPATLYELVKFAGEGGVGDWRPQKGGVHGVFRMAAPNEVW